jgi:exosortase A
LKIETLRLPDTLLPGQLPHPVRSEALIGALVLGALVWLLGWYWDTALSAVETWQRSDTFAHGFLVVPISAWLVWRQRHVLAAIQFRPDFLALPLLAIVGFGWLLAQLGGVTVVQQFGLVLMIVLSVWAILGTQAVRTLAFPLFFLLFAVPFGEFLEPPLMEHTADFTVAALRLSGIPVYRDGLYFMLPSGSWSVVEACSGLRYLIASVTLGFLYAYLTYRSFTRRALFVAASLLVPIVANWLRAYMIVMIGHLSEMKYAVGVDHLLYGWVFFGVVMLLLFWIGSYWREDLKPLEQAPSVVPAPRNARSMALIAVATLAVAGIAAAWPLVGARIEGMIAYGPPALEAPRGAGGWQRVEGGRLSSWTPRFHNYQASIREVYASGAHGAGLVIVYYRHQGPGAQVVSSKNRIVSGDDRQWRRSSAFRRVVTAGTMEIPVVEETLRSPSSQLLVWRWYWIDGQYVVNPYWAKVLQAKSQLLGRGDDAAAVIVYTVTNDGAPAAEQRLREFLRGLLPGITTSLERARRAQSDS